MPSSACCHSTRILRSFPTRRSSDLPALRLAQFAKQQGIGYQLGCQVGETAILSAAGRHFAGSVADLKHAEGSYDRHLVRESLATEEDRKSTRLNSSHANISYAVFCLLPQHPHPPLFPYTTLFRSPGAAAGAVREATGDRLSARLPGRRDGDPLRRGPALRRQRRRPQACRRLLRPAPRARVTRHRGRSEEHTSELQSRQYIVCRLLLAATAPASSALSLHDALPISRRCGWRSSRSNRGSAISSAARSARRRSSPPRAGTSPAASPTSSMPKAPTTGTSCASHSPPRKIGRAHV